jgi:hypothetical protein
MEDKNLTTLGAIVIFMGRMNTMIQSFYAKGVCIVNFECYYRPMLTLTLQIERDQTQRGSCVITECWANVGDTVVHLTDRYELVGPYIKDGMVNMVVYIAHLDMYFHVIEKRWLAQLEAYGFKLEPQKNNS